MCMSTLHRRSFVNATLLLHLMTSTSGAMRNFGRSFTQFLQVVGCSDLKYAPNTEHVYECSEPQKRTFMSAATRISKVSHYCTNSGNSHICLHKMVLTLACSFWVVNTASNTTNIKTTVFQQLWIIKTLSAINFLQNASTRQRDQCDHSGTSSQFHKFLRNCISQLVQLLWHNLHHKRCASGLT